MDDNDAFFTQTIVGAPFSVLLGRQLEARRAQAEGAEMNMRSADARLSGGWTEWVVMRRAYDNVGLPRRRPGRLRRWLERHALWLALLGVLGMFVTGVFWGLTLWT